MLVRVIIELWDLIDSCLEIVDLKMYQTSFNILCLLASLLRHFQVTMTSFSFSNTILKFSLWFQALDQDYSRLSLKMELYPVQQVLSCGVNLDYLPPLLFPWIYIWGIRWIDIIFPDHFMLFVVLKTYNWIYRYIVSLYLWNIIYYISMFLIYKLRA